MPDTVDFSPLTLLCVCEGTNGIECTLDRLTVTCTVGNHGQDIAALTLYPPYGTTSEYVFVDGTMTYTLDLRNVRSNIRMRWDSYSSSFQDVKAWSEASIGYVARYLCISGVSSYYKPVDPLVGGVGSSAICEDPTPPITSNAVSIFPTGAFSSREWSRPLGPCWPMPVFGSAELFAEQTIIDKPPEGDLCLCASGGSTVTGTSLEGTPVVIEASNFYYFSISSGHLPGGQYLDPKTGCILGMPDGTPGSTSIVFRVTDTQSGEYAEVECSFAPETCSGRSSNTMRRNGFY